jgi:WD40 repeat protein
VWHLDTGEELLTLNGHSDCVSAVALSPDDTKVISGSWDNTLKVWHLEKGEVIASFTGDSQLICCAFAPDGMTIVAGDALGRMHFLRLEGSR